jgi:starch phosphorylase
VPHPKDAWANDALRIILSLLAEKFRNEIVYVPNYNPEIAKMLVAGCDVWVNTPQVGLEACGTSGMKAALNGLLSLSTADGWMAEIDMKRIGWELDDADVSGSMYSALEQHIVPAYATYLTHHDRFGWLHKMMDAHMMIRNRFSTRRMVQEYSEHLWTFQETNSKALPDKIVPEQHSQQPSPSIFAQQ